MTERNEFIIYFKSSASSQDFQCPHCGSQKVYIHDRRETYLRDFPDNPNQYQTIALRYNKFKCKECRRQFTEDIKLKEPHTRITTRAARWLEYLLSFNLPIKAVQEITGIDWHTIRKINSKSIKEVLERRRQSLELSGYKPRYLAVDEFAIHKGHSYATCVMDIFTGEIIWVGQGKSIESFRKFFKDYTLDYLSEVKAVAMDMNASYNKLVKEYLPNASIVV